MTGNVLIIHYFIVFLYYRTISLSHQFCFIYMYLTSVSAIQYNFRHYKFFTYVIFLTSMTITFLLMLYFLKMRFLYFWMLILLHITSNIQSNNGFDSLTQLNKLLIIDDHNYFKHSDYIKSQDPIAHLLDSLYKV